MCFPDIELLSNEIFFKVLKRETERYYAFFNYIYLSEEIFLVLTYIDAERRYWEILRF